MTDQERLYRIRELVEDLMDDAADQQDQYRLDMLADIWDLTNAVDTEQ